MCVYLPWCVVWQPLSPVSGPDYCLTQAFIKLMADRQHPPLQAVEQTEVSQS